MTVYMIGRNFSWFEGGFRVFFKVDNSPGAKS
jgi:hypothetical protein